MFLLEWTASDLLLIALAAVAMIGTVIWLVPSAKVERKQHYSQEEITAYEHQIPRYFIAAAIALVLGSVHMVVKSTPGFWQWLWEAGYGGHLFRDLSNSHIIIVGGGTVLLTGLTWYVLPRFTNRPLFSNALAGASFWFTVIGVFGFYLAWLILGLVEGNLVRHGMDYMAAKDVVGAWHRVPTRLTSSIMGVGYWTYVLNVVLTIWAARYVTKKPLGYLTKFIAVSAAALFVGTVQGVLQVLPANADWIHYAGKFGQYVDPISHAHVNLVTGMMVALSGFLVYFSQRLGGKQLGEREANRVFWTLVPGSLIFYLTFLFSGLILGGAVNGYGGLQVPALVPLFSRYLPVMIATAGTVMLVGFWFYFGTLWKALDLKSIRRHVRQATPAAFWLVSSLALVVGTFQGLLQALPSTAQILTAPEEVPNIHAQLNMIGGVMLALIGLVYLLTPDLLDRQIDRKLARISLYGISGGIGAYYLATIITGFMRIAFLKLGYTQAQGSVMLGWAGPAALMITAIPILIGFIAFARAIFKVTHEYRTEMSQELRSTPQKFAGPMPERLRKIPNVYVIGMEFIGGLFGWPGIGWLFAGQALPGIALMMIGPSISWALLPMLFSPYTETVFSQWGWQVLLVWLPGTALLSSAFLGLYLRRLQRAYASKKPLKIDSGLRAAIADGLDLIKKVRRNNDQSRLGSRKTGTPIPKGLFFGFGMIIVLLLSIPVTPLIFGIPEGSTQQSMMSELPDRADGAYLTVSDGSQTGLIKLFAWSFPVDDFPAESPAISPEQFQNVLISQKGLDSPDRYQLFHLADGDQISLQAQEVSFQRKMQIKPKEALEDGAYLLDIPTGGMFAGREYYYFRIDSTISKLPALVMVADSSATPPTGSARTNANKSIWIEIFPISAALISAGMVVIMLRRIFLKIRPQEVVWMLAFAMFSIAAGCQVLGDLFGWTTLLVRIYYVFGATLVVGWLGLGTWFVMVRMRWLRQAGLWLMILVSGYGLGLISSLEVDSARLATDGWHALVSSPSLTVLTITVNSLGTLVLVGGALWSAWIFWRKGIMRQRMLGLILLAAGALTVAAGGGLTRLGHQQYLYIAMSVGVGLMFWGYLKTILPIAQPSGNTGRRQIDETRPVEALS